MAIQWFVQHGGKQYGPLTSANLKKLADEGKISPTTTVRSGTEGEWVPASRVKGLFAAASPANAPPASSKPAAAPRNPAHLAAPPVAPPPAPKVARAVAHDPLARAAVAPLPKATPISKATPAASGSMPAKILGAVGLIFGILALATCWLPALQSAVGWTPIVVGGLGLVLAATGLTLAAVNKGSGLALGVAGSSSSLVGLVLGVVLGIQFGLFGGKPAPLPVVVAPPAAPPVQAAPPPPAAEPAPEIVWTDAAEAIEQPPIRARIVSAKIEQVKLESTDISTLKRPKPQPMLKIKVLIENSSTDKIVEFGGWVGGGDLVGQGLGNLLGDEAGKALASATTSAVLVDSSGNNYKQTPMMNVFGAGVHVGKDNSIRPEKSAETDLVFPPPLASIEFLRLELSPAAFGGEEPLRWQIPRAMIGGLPPLEIKPKAAEPAAEAVEETVPDADSEAQ